MLAEEQVFAMFVKMTHAGLVKVAFAIGTHGGFVLDVPLQATLITMGGAVELAVTSFAAAIQQDVVVDASSLGWSGRT